MFRKDIRNAARPTGTAAPEEIARFNALAEEWWNPSGAFKVIHAFNAARVQHLSQRLPALLNCDPGAARPLTGKRILDVGCGAGLVSEPLSRLGGDILGIDAAERNVMIARRHADLTGAQVRYRHALPEDLTDQTSSYDVVLSLEVVEHVADLPGFLAAIAHLVAPGGILVIGTLNRTFGSFVRAIIAAEYILRWLPRGTHEWRKFVKPEQLAAELRRSGLVVEERAGVVLNPLTMRWRIADDCGAAYLQVHRREVLGRVDA